jgi:hypothetical protein
VTAHFFVTPQDPKAWLNFSTNFIGALARLIGIHPVSISDSTKLGELLAGAGESATNPNASRLV